MGLVASLLGLAAGCAGPGPATPTATASPSTPAARATPPVTSTPTRTPTPTPGTSATPSAAGGDRVQSLASTAAGELPPGRYTRDSFVPYLSFEVGTGWRAVQAVGGFFDVERHPGTLDVVSVQFARPTGHADAAAAIAGLASSSELKVSDAGPVTIGGLTGVRITVDAADPDIDASRFVPVFSVDAGSISLASGRRLRIAMLDTPDGLLAILVGGSVRTWDASIEVAQPIVDSVRFRP
jgi:hypothetical protein